MNMTVAEIHRGNNKSLENKYRVLHTLQMLLFVIDSNNIQNYVELY